MGDILKMSLKERRSLIELTRVKDGQQTLIAASERLDITYRHALRLNKRFQEKGARGLVHRGRGRRSNRSYPESFREECLELYALRMSGYGPTFASEKLAELGKTVHPETLRLWLREAGLWERQRRHGPHRHWREPKKHFGEMIQMDGSFHDWFEDGQLYCLMNMVDDATGITYAQFYSGETTAAAMGILWDWIEKYGVPRSLYTDRKNVYVTNREPTIDEELADETPLTAFGKACQKLGIRIIEAHSPQAKGRVERKNGVLQDRLIKDMAFHGITGVEPGNAWLRKRFLGSLNKQFARKPLSDVDFHQVLPTGTNLAEVFAWEEQRTVQDDGTIRWENRWFQLLKGDFQPGKKKVTVQTRLDGAIHIQYRGNSLKYKEIAKPDRNRSTKAFQSSTHKVAQPKAKNHPWRGTFLNSAKRKKQMFQEQAKETKQNPGKPGDSVPGPLGFNALG